MRNKFIYILLISFLALFLTSGAKGKNSEIVTKSFKVDKNGNLDVKINQGDIYIKTWDKDEVLIKADGIDEDEINELSFRKNGNTVIVDYSDQWGWAANADYYFTVPSKFNLDIFTTNGDIDIRNNIDGNVKIQTRDGDIDIMSVAGDLSIETMGGDIYLEDATGRTSISTYGGDITAKKLSGSVKMIKTMGGDIFLHFIKNVKEVVTYGGDITIDESAGDIEVTTFGGDIAISKADGSVTAKTYGGDIEVAGAKGFVDVNTGGGDIELKNITGAVDAKTAAGYIYVELTPTGSRDSDIRTTAGDVTLLIPSNANTTVEAEVNTIRMINSEWDEIESDFKGDVTKTRTKIKGIYSINGGTRSSIRVEVTHGTIQLKKKR